jgi:hypothetical protein
MCLTEEENVKAWLVQLAIRNKRKVAKMIESFPFEMSGLHTQATLNILPLGSYDILLGMDWLATHKGKLNYYEKTLECEDEEGNEKIFQGNWKPISVRKISALQLKKFSWKGSPLYVIQVLSSTKRNELKFEDHPMMWEFKDVFP